MIDFRKEKIFFFAFRDRQTEQYRPIKVKYVSKVNEMLYEDCAAKKLRKLVDNINMLYYKVK
nr:MAG TPA: hypothetical protein [Caudoviricetes sp.]